MSVLIKDGRAVIEAVDAAIDRYGAKRDELIPILSDVNHKLGYIPPEAFDEISRRLRTPKSQLFSVASFYQMLSTKPVGRHLVQFCESAPCHVAGGRLVWRALLDGLKLEDGQTSEDGKWTLKTVSCLGICGVGPVMVIDEDIYGNLKPEQIPDILARYE